jgi:membrane-associated phospholipid phosphatase
LKRIIPAFSFLITLLLSSQAVAQSREFPYQLHKKDFYLLPAGVVLEISSNYLSRKKDHNLTRDEIAILDRNDINRFDRNATYHWNRSADDFSNVVNRMMPFVPMTLGIPQLRNKQWNNIITLGVMYTEVYFFTHSLTGLTKSFTGRIRPYLYNTSLSVDERFEVQGNGAPTASTSFISGHSSATFAYAVFFAKSFTDIYGKSTWSTVIWITSLTLASATAYSRVAAGEHYPTDVLAGALVGSAIGYFIPELHKKKSEKLSLSIFPNNFSIAYKF